MHFFYTSVRTKLTLLLLITIVIPELILGIIYPIYFQRVMEKDKEALMEGTLTAITRSIETYMDDLERLTITPFLQNDILTSLKIKARSDQNHVSVYNKLVADRTLHEMQMIMFQNTRKDILGTVLVTADQSVYATDRYEVAQPIPDFPYKAQDWYKQTILRNGKATFISPHRRDYLQNSQDQLVFSVARLIKDPDTQKPLAVIMADADNDIFDEIVSDVSFDVSSIVTIFDNYNNLIYSSDPLTAGTAEQIIADHELIESQGKNYTTISKRIPSSEWRVNVLLSQSEITSKIRNLNLISIVMTCMGLLLTALFYVYLSRSIVKPILQMGAVMRKVQHGSMNESVTIKGQDEIAYLGNRLNKMISQLNDTIIREYRTGLAKRNAEYRALQSQIQPHFLYNTLNGFMALNRAGESKTLEKAILSLSGMMRYTLSKNDWDTLENEFLFLQRYAEIQQLRFDERLTFQLDYDPRTKDVRIPKLLLQPLVENSIIHGVEGVNRACRVSVKAELIHENEPNNILIRVTDTGAGFDLDQLEKQDRVGISNVRERLEMAYPYASMTVNSIREVGTEVTLHIKTSPDEADPASPMDNIGNTRRTDA
ncbi:cache domain-containing sensor histidine kinase [Paenibacillus guangzhouensis]|uniref:cache domain-containing sensor histidine kinase n=1 Tax=Paenibacillus guangzhouensis TaxID=1473112 RepID=UPI0012673D99|nr:sensor histidine kinase [Paenibacillus guangzhouensis]